MVHAVIREGLVHENLDNKASDLQERTRMNRRKLLAGALNQQVAPIV